MFLFYVHFIISFKYKPLQFVLKGLVFLLLNQYYYLPNNALDFVTTLSIVKPNTL